MSSKNDLINKTLATIETAINSGQYQDVENSRIELKDLSGGKKWTSLKETICAFLNTNGGYIICGIREDGKSYKITGFDRHNESNLIDLQSKFFKDDNDILIGLNENIQFDYQMILGKPIAVIEISPLREDLKYVNINNKYYRRNLTQDNIIPNDELNRHKEYKLELINSKEIGTVPNATLEDLDIDKINQFILKINISSKKETIKSNLESAIDFLIRRHCVNKEKEITVLGLLLFGKDPFQNLEYRAEIDCYFETGDSIGRDKKNFKDDVLTLMDDAFHFVWGHIKVGRSFIGGGRSEPEYPEELIREVINNAIAHRDYTINRFITITINPGRSLEITNPGSFKQKMLLTDTKSEVVIRRVIPNIPETKNPKLADILKTFDKIESQGRGMSTLVDACLSKNMIDVPYYDLSVPDTIKLVVPSGKLMDDETEKWKNSFYTYIDEKLKNRTKEEHLFVLAYLYKSEKLNKFNRYSILLSESNNHSKVLSDLKIAGLIIEHFKANYEHGAIYIVDRELTLTDFESQIEKKIGKELKKYGRNIRDVLNIIYRYNHYNKQAIKPSLITPELYSQLYGKDSNPTKYATLERKARKICSELFKDGILTKDKNGYSINNESGPEETELF